jgi:hypothetical protein
MQFCCGTAFLKTTEIPHVARLLDEAGFDGIITVDHLIYPRVLNSPYPTPAGKPQVDRQAVVVVVGVAGEHAHSDAVGLVPDGEAGVSLEQAAALITVTPGVIFQRRVPIVVQNPGTPSHFALSPAAFAPATAPWSTASCQCSTTRGRPAQELKASAASPAA